MLHAHSLRCSFKREPHPASTIIFLYKWADTLHFKEHLRTTSYRLCIWRGSDGILSRRHAKHKALQKCVCACVCVHVHYLFITPESVACSSEVLLGNLNGSRLNAINWRQRPLADDVSHGEGTTRWRTAERLRVDCKVSAP
jgi:hypothetical protein